MNPSVTLAAALAAAALAGSARADEWFMTEKPADCPDELYLEFTRNGNRKNYQDCLFRRIDALERLVEREGKARDGACAAKIAEYLESFCDLRSWTLPAHDGRLTCFNGTPHVDLVSARIGLDFARALAVCGDRIPAATLARSRSELERRTFDPYLASVRGTWKTEDHWWFRTRSNWNAVCHSCVLRAALAYYPEGSAERAEIVGAATGAVPAFLSGFTDDGYCSEGAGYWNYGYGHFLEMAVALRDAPEKIDLFVRHPKTETVARYGFEYVLSPGVSPLFADGGGHPEERFLAICSKVWPGMPRNPGVRSEFPIAQVWLERPAEGKDGIAIGFKGGHNDEFHNHNDVGSYDISLDGVIVTGDPGGEEYTRRTFSDRRYESKVLNSYAHPVPRVDGKLQGTGRGYAAKIVSRTFTDAKDVVVLDIAGAYDCDKLASLVRTFEYDRAAGKIVVTDRVRFSGPASFEVPMVSLGGFGEGTVLAPNGARSLRVEVSAKGGKWSWRDETVENPGRIPPKIRSAFFESVTDAEISFAFSR